jgi:hypothetical protein
VISPFENLALSLSAADQYSCARIYAKDKYPPRAPLWRGERYRRDKIRLGYLSADFRNHAVASLTAAVFETSRPHPFRDDRVFIRLREARRHADPSRSRLPSVYRCRARE